MSKHLEGLTEPQKDLLVYMKDDNRSVRAETYKDDRNVLISKGLAKRYGKNYECTPEGEKCAKIIKGERL